MQFIAAAMNVCLKARDSLSESLNADTVADTVWPASRHRQLL